MKKIARWLEGKFSKHLPIVYYHLVQRPRFALKFRTEAKLARGTHLSMSTQQSFVFFTTQKCASVYVSSILAQLSAAAGMKHADYDAYVTMTKVPSSNHPFKDAVSKAFRTSGYYYGPIGTYREIPKLDEFKVLLQLRDPRDLLTSLYFSTAFSHAVISPKLVRRRQAAQHQDIDTYVLENAEEYVRIFDSYVKHLLGRPGILFVKYEEMVSDFPSWLSKVSTHLGLTAHPEVLNNIQREASFSVSKEDAYTHKRQVTPGDHLRKLKAETIAQVNQLFEPVLSKLEY